MYGASYIHREVKSSLIPMLPNLFNKREKRGEAWDPMSCVWRSPIYQGRKGGGLWKLRVGERNFWALWFDAGEKEGYTDYQRG